MIRLLMMRVLGVLLALSLVTPAFAQDNVARGLAIQAMQKASTAAVDPTARAILQGGGTTADKIAFRKSMLNSTAPIAFIEFGQSNEAGSAEIISSAATGSVDQRIANPGAFRSLIFPYQTGAYEGRMSFAYKPGTSDPATLIGFSGSSIPTIVDRLYTAGYDVHPANLSIGGLSFVNHIAQKWGYRELAPTKQIAEQRAPIGFVDQGDYGTGIYDSGFLWFASQANTRMAVYDNAAGPPKYSSDGTVVIPGVGDFITIYGNRQSAGRTAIPFLAEWVGTGSISNNVLTIDSTTSGAPAVGQTLAADNNGLDKTVTILSGSGSTWQLSTSTLSLSSRQLFGTTIGADRVDGGIKWRATAVANVRGISPNGIEVTGFGAPFDKLGILRRVVRKVQDMYARGARLVVVDISNGQSDTSSTQFDYQKILEGIIGPLRGAGAVVSVGLSSFTRGGSVADWDKLSAGRTAALATYANDNGVFAGANVYQLMGTVEGQNGLKFNTGGSAANDGVHLDASAQIVVGNFKATPIVSYLDAHPIAVGQ